MKTLPTLVLLGLLLGCEGDRSAPSAPVVGSKALAVRRPNIVVIMADDLDVSTVEALLGAGLMPHLQRDLLDVGVDFTNSFATNPLCAPSRATFLTGQYSHHHGVLYNKGGPEGGFAAFDDRSTIATWVRAAGYRTGHVGKYLNGNGRSFPPYASGQAGDPRTYIPPGWDDWQGLVGNTTYHVYDYLINDNGRLVQYGSAVRDYQTDVLARRAARFIEDAEVRNDHRPFFLVVNPLAPHFEELENRGDWWSWTIRPAPRHVGTTDAIRLPRPPSFNEADLSDKPAWLQTFPALLPNDIHDLTNQWHDRLASLRAVDDLIGRVVSTLRAAGELDNTVLVFTADNGFISGQHRLSQKMCAYEESARVPLVIRAPGVAGGRRAAEMVLNNDLAPTIADWAGAAPTRPVDGRSLVPVLQGSAANWRNRALLEHWKAPLLDSYLPTYQAVRSAETDPLVPRRLYVEYEAGQGTELYDLNVDPYEVGSLHADPAAAWQRGILASQLQALRASGPSAED